MYNQLTTEDRYTIATLLTQHLSYREIAEHICRNVSTVSREINRNKCRDGAYRAFKAISKTAGRRRRSRQKWYFHDIQWEMVVGLLQNDWSPEQISLWLKKNKIFDISHSTIYRFIWYDCFYHGTLYKHLRQSGKKRRKKYRRPDSRGVLPNKRHITERPLSAENKNRIGHFEIDTVQGKGDTHCIVTLVDRKSKYTIIGKLSAKSTSELNKKVIELIKRQPRKVKTITSDNGTEFHGYENIEKLTGAKFYFANPYHSWERGLNENTNGLIRQYLPKGKSMKHITQVDCDKIALKLNRRPRKCLNMKTPEQVYVN